MSAAPRVTASKLSKAGTNSPAAKTFMVRRPSVASPMLLAKRSAAVPWPGKFLGQVVTMRHSTLPCEIAGAGKLPAAAAAAAPPTAAVVKNLRLSIIAPSPLPP